MPSLQFGPWTAGIVNSSRDYTLPKGAVLDALNVDFTDKGTAVTRRGYSQTVAVDNGHSLKTLGGKTLMGVGTELHVITAMSPLATGSSGSMPSRSWPREVGCWWPTACTWQGCSSPRCTGVWSASVCAERNGRSRRATRSTAANGTG